MTLIISLCKDKLSELEFVRPIELLVGECTVKHHSKVKTNDIKNANRIILTGTALADFEYLNGNFEWLKTTDKPVLGICAGMQIIAKQFGIPLKKKTTIGVRPVEVVKENKLCDATFNAYFLHTLTGTGNFETLAKSEGTPCMIKHPQKQIFGCIFHPEVMNEEIIREFVRV